MDAMETGNVAAEKARARKLFRARRAALAPEARQAQSVAICSQLLPFLHERRMRTLSAFWPLAEEVDLRPLLRGLAASGVTVALPVVVSERGDRPRLVHRAFQGDAALARGRFGVMEPLATAPLVAPRDVEVALVPALAVDARGVRLGYGGGFYDAFLAQTEAMRVAVVFASGVAARLPAEPHDARVDWTVTPEAARAAT
ncbi:5-formyltetrahydrofolate cyclo-ligase [Rubricoccus marinus]|uniref:5-formyltetrahydrofolate cyclo-ligase n=1 Tax=Rubricoccus marinus TaxID=716817 RepID=A0A259U007_9BACT|nr:5-formyltetrahydrofolate cyclo-ligase [Rubricoccus marinus]OZC03177.1 5-formyltetrahydrofolate cyclo-ligase [Rubricoccus marinus]